MGLRQAQRAQQKVKEDGADRWYDLAVGQGASANQEENLAEEERRQQLVNWLELQWPLNAAADCEF